MEIQNQDPKKVLKLMAFMLISSGKDIFTPTEMIEKKLSIKNTDDDAIDASIALAKSKDKEEMIKFLMMQFLTVTQLMDLGDWLHEHAKELLEYINEHPDCQDNRTSDEKSETLLKALFSA